MKTIKVVFGKAECLAASKGLPHDSKIMEFETSQEAIAYMRGCNDSNGWEQVSIETDGTMSLPSDLNDLWDVK